MSIKVKLIKKRDKDGRLEAVVVQINRSGLIEKRHFATEKDAMAFIQELKNNMDHS